MLPGIFNGVSLYILKKCPMRQSAPWDKVPRETKCLMSHTSTFTHKIPWISQLTYRSSRSFSGFFQKPKVLPSSCILFLYLVLAVKSRRIYCSRWRCVCKSPILDLRFVGVRTDTRLRHHSTAYTVLLSLWRLYRVAVFYPPRHTLWLLLAYQIRQTRPRPAQYCKRGLLYFKHASRAVVTYAGQNDADRVLPA